jgi:sugar/nucleoside kinase (ribokinase family)
VLGGPEAVLELVGAVVVTHGRQGASWYAGGVRAHVPAPALHETDSTGAGDAFNAGLLATWLSGGDEIAALAAGVAAGTAAAAAVGARPSAGT